MKADAGDGELLDRLTPKQNTLAWKTKYRPTWSVPARASSKASFACTAAYPAITYLIHLNKQHFRPCNSRNTTTIEHQFEDFNTSVRDGRWRWCQNRHHLTTHTLKRLKPPPPTPKHLNRLKPSPTFTMGHRCCLKRAFEGGCLKSGSGQPHGVIGWPLHQ